MGRTATRGARHVRRAICIPVLMSLSFRRCRYAGLQNTFFIQASDILTRRENLRAFVALCE